MLSGNPGIKKVIIERATAKDLRSGRIQLVKPWAKSSLKKLQKALSV